VAPQLALDELFGHVQGAYTDARKMRTGRIATAGGGTLLLDDIQNLDLGVQKQLLQVLDRGSYSPVGSDRVLAVACRIVLAMTESPLILMRRGQLLKDLRFRLGSCDVRIPPLRERSLEIPVLAKQALAKCAERTGIAGPSRLTDEALRALQGGEYEGNVRELYAAVEYSYLIARAVGRSEIRSEDLPEDVRPLLAYRRHGDRRANRIAAERALTKSGGEITAAARILGISRNALSRLLARTSKALDDSRKVAR
jgi:DNA-binding NtrC family response regulator